MGDLVLTGEAEGFAPTTIRVAVGTNTGPIRLVMSRGKPLTVRVADRNGNPVANAGVNVQRDLGTSDGASMSQTFRAERRTDSNGVASFPALPEYDLWVGVGANGFIRQDGSKVRAGGADLLVTLVSNLVVSGTVHDSDTGKPIPKFRIRTGRPEDPPRGPYFTDIDRFVLNFAGGEFRHVYDEATAVGPNPGYLLRFESDGYAPYVSRLIKPEEGTVQLEVTLHPVSTRTFSVLNPDGTPAAWADVGLPERTRGNYSVAVMPGGLERYGQDGTGPLQQTDAQGIIRLPSDEEIHLVVAANHAGYLETNLDAVPDGGSIQLQPWGRIEGSLPEPEKSRANQELWISKIDRPGNGLMAGRSFNVKPDVTGHFVMPRVPPWQLAVSVGTKTTTSAGQWTLGSSRMAQVEVRPGETTQVTFEQQSDTANR